MREFYLVSNPHTPEADTYTYTKDILLIDHESRNLLVNDCSGAGSLVLGVTLGAILGATLGLGLVKSNGVDTVLSLGSLITGS